MFSWSFRRPVDSRRQSALMKEANETMTGNKQLISDMKSMLERASEAAGIAWGALWGGDGHLESMI